ncbi:MAG: hypothetical protein CR217_10815 [Beijerinckiaceae bacterium]|nr:MAG: hypothetical protein CR217_10815 [Beijerinckiaceae bacterium]
MKPYVAIAASLAALASVQAHAAQTIQFPMTVSAGAKTCLPNASANVIVHSFGDFENLEIVISGLPANTVFDFFIIQVPTAPFGVAWYMGDVTTGGGGIGVGNFVGRFSSETFIISPGVAPTVNKFPSPPAFVPEATTGIVTNPIQMYHLGLWFNSALDAAKAGCPATPTGFNGEHNAGIQVLNTSNFSLLAGPLIKIP